MSRRQQGARMSRRMPGGAAPFHPLQLSPVVWYRADLGVTLNGSNVSAWADQSGSGDTNKNAVQAVAGSQPAYNATDSNYGGKPSITAVAGSKFLATGTFTTPTAQPTTIYVCGVLGAGGRIYDGSTAGNRQAILAQTNHWSYYAGSAVREGTTDMLTRSVCCAVFNGASSALYISSSSTAESTANPGTNQLDNFGILGTSDGAGLGIAEIAELIAYSGSHDAATRLRVMAYMGNRYGKVVT